MKSMKFHFEYSMQPLPEFLARKTVRDYVCSNCWGQLTLHYDCENFTVECGKCGEETRGYVTRYYADRRREASQFEKREAERLLRRLNIIPSPPKLPEGEILKSLGF